MRKHPKREQSAAEFLESTLRKAAIENGRCILRIAAIAAIEPILTLGELSSDDKLHSINIILAIMRELEQDETIPLVVGEPFRFSGQAN